MIAVAPYGTSTGNNKGYNNYSDKLFCAAYLVRTHGTVFFGRSNTADGTPGITAGLGG